MQKTSFFHIISVFLGSLVLVLVIAPIVGLLLETSFQDFINTTSEKELHRSISTTLTTCLVSTLILSVMVVPFSYFLARSKFYGKNIISHIIELPMYLPHTVAGLAILSVVSRETMLGQIAHNLGIDIIDNPIGIGLAVAFVCSGILVNQSRIAFEQIPVKLEHAAYTLGASYFKVFRTIALPLAWRNVVSGMMLMFAKGISEFGVIIMVAYSPKVNSTLVYEKFINQGFSQAAPSATILLFISVLVFFIFKLLTINFNKIKKYKLNNSVKDSDA